MGGWLWGGTDEADAVRAIHAALEAGVNLIDTAPVYGLGLSEEIVGKAIAGRRDQVVLATKCGLVWHTTRGVMFLEQNGRPVHKFLGPDSVRYELEQSLKRLQTDYLDLYQTHRQDATTPLEETVGTLLDLKREGKIRAIGVSNVTTEQLDAYRRAGPLDSDQERYNLLDRGHEGSLLPYCREHGLAFLAYSPLLYGLLTGKIGPAREFTGDDLRRHNPRFTPASRARIAAALARLQALADGRGVSVAQLVLGWTLAQPGVTHALVGARQARHAVENAHAGDVTLSQEELSAVTAAIPAL
jgi:aryl-alcohol dehydrogenase-like predicted oxidoreductase